MLKKLFHTRRLLYISSIVLLSACNNEIDVIDVYKETPIIYGLLNAYDSTQYVRVQKAFLGEANALLMAQHPDSLYYDTADVSVTLIKSKNNQVIDSLKLNPTLEILKDEGLFANYPHIMYKSDGMKLLDPNASYSLYFYNKKSGITITAQTPIVKQLTLYPLLPSPLPDPSSTINFASDQPMKISVVAPANGKFLSLTIRMKYIELFVGTSQSQEKTLNYNLPVFVSTNTVGGQIFEYEIYGQAFYQFIGRSVKNDPSIYRESTKFRMDFIFTVGAEEFYTYYLINKPSTSINDNIPDYTNLSSGKGLFSSRSTRIYPDKELNNASRDSLIYGLFTRGLFH